METLADAHNQMTRTLECDRDIDRPYLTGQGPVCGGVVNHQAVAPQRDRFVCLSPGGEAGTGAAAAAGVGAAATPGAPHPEEPGAGEHRAAQSQKEDAGVRAGGLGKHTDTVD